MRVALLAILVALAMASPVSAGSLSASVDPTARLTGSGDVLLRLTIDCAADHAVLEAFVYVTQEGEQSSFASIPLQCGSGRRVYMTRAAPGSAIFEPGPASVSGYILVQDVDTGAVHSLSFGGTVSLS
jgi:hypothetical protein